MVKVKGWKCVKVFELCDVKGGKRLPKGYYLSKKYSGYPYIRVADMNNGYVELEDIHYVPIEAVNQIRNYRIEEEDLFISVAGTLGIVGEIPKILNKANLTENANKLTNIKCDKKYLMYFLLSEKIQSVISGISTVGAQPKLALSRIKNFDVYLPENIQEQKLISEALSDMDQLIASLVKKIKKKRTIKHGTVQKFFGESLRNYCSVTLGELCSVVTKQTGFDYTLIIKPNLANSKTSNSIPMLQTKNFEGRKFDFNTDYYIAEEIAQQFSNIVLDEKCLLLSIVGASVGNIGLFEGEKKAFCGGAICIAKPYSEKDAEYLYYYMSSDLGQSQIRNSTKVGGQCTVTVEDIRNFEIFYPESSVRNKIIRLLMDLDNEIDALESKISKYRHIKQGMMQELLTARIPLI